MALNYTSIDVEKLSQKEGNRLNFYLLLVVTFSAAFLAVLLFILIQKKIHPTAPTKIENQIKVPSPTIVEIIDNIPTLQEASPTSIIEITQPATSSPTIIAPDETTQSAKIGSDSAQ